MICNTIPMMKIYVNKSMKFGEIVPIVLKTLRSPVGRMTSHPDVNSQSAARLGHVRKKIRNSKLEKDISLDKIIKRKLRS